MKNKTESVTSKDGTIIKYQVMGQGPGLVILSGANTASQDYMGLASHLENDYTVYVVERRGRNGSGPQGEDYSIQKECEDTIALLDKIKSPYLFGHSYGGLIALNVARRYRLTKVALYEPAVSINGSIPTAWLAKYERLVAKQDYLGALVTLIKGLRLGGKFNFLPDAVFKRMAKSFVDDEGVKEMAELMPTVAREAREGIKLDSKVEQYAQITAETLLIAGKKSPAYFHTALRVLQPVIPHSQIQALSGMDHSAPNEHPDVIAKALKEFFDR